jgi:hypothetical protein
MSCLPALPEQLALSRFVHRAASNVKYQDAVVFDGKERSVSPGSLAMKELVDGRANQVVLRRKATARWILGE